MRKRLRTRFYLILISLFIGISVYSQKDIKVVLINGGTFEQGSNSKHFKDETPKHKVRIDTFYLAQYEMSYDEYKAFCKVAGFSDPYGVPGFPATNISWERAVMMCNWLSRREGFDKAYKITRDDKAGTRDFIIDTQTGTVYQHFDHKWVEVIWDFEESLFK